jgi:hypothetical protein
LVPPSTRVISLFWGDKYVLHYFGMKGCESTLYSPMVPSNKNPTTITLLYLYLLFPGIKRKIKKS